jgi:hypothetical protein
MNKGGQNQIGNGKRNIPGGFKKTFDSMPYNKRTEIRNEICILCFWSISTFRQRVIGLRPFRIFEIKAIESYFAAKGINAWTGEPINKQ